jgi:L-histidine N-alpha-methyltransferase
MRVLIPEIHLEIDFAEGEELSTEISAKFQPHTVRAELDKAGFASAAWWTDTEARFALSLWQAV